MSMDVRPGDLWQLGRHRLLCGDSTTARDLHRLMGMERADLIFTDPPYGVAYTDTSGTSLDYGDITYTAIPLMFSLLDEMLAPTGWLYTCGGQINAPLYGKLFERYFKAAPRLIIWDKCRMRIRRCGYHSAYELIYFGFRRGGGSKWYGPRGGEADTDIWRVPLAEKREHLTQKPVELCARAIRNSSPSGGLVADPFLGSGSMLIAAEREGRRCYGVEMDPRYCAVTIHRWQDETGLTASLVERTTEAVA